MVESQADEMSAWASGNGLSFKETGLLPPETTFLRKGTGVGEHRSSLSVARVGKRMRETSWTKKRAERASFNLCEGRLPGGLTGVLAHHVYLTDHGHGLSEGEERYQGRVGTAVFAKLPSGSRASFNLTIGRKPDVQSGITIGGSKEPSKDPLESVYALPSGKLPLEEFQLATWPAEPEDRMRSIAGAAVEQSLAGLPQTTRVECESGSLCVYIEGDAVSDPTILDELCHFASSLAEGIADVVAETPALEPGEALGAWPATSYSEWVGKGADLVSWDTPPPSVVAAQQAYEPVIEKKANRSGLAIFGVASIALLLISILAAGGWFVANLLFGTRLIGIVGAVVIMILGLRSVRRTGLRTGIEDKEGRIRSTTVPWGLEAFGREYAKASGLTREDPDELRRRLPMPVPGRVQLAWQGDLGEGCHGHLAIWIDPCTNPAAPTFWLVAVAEGPIEVKDPTRRANLDGLGIAGVEVDSVGRSSHRLDWLREQVVASAASGTPAPGGSDIDAEGRPRWAG